MARKTQIDVILAGDRVRQAHLNREFRRMNQSAFQSIATNAAVLADGAASNAFKGTLPFFLANPPAPRKRRRRR